MLTPYEVTFPERKQWVQEELEKKRRQWWDAVNEKESLERDIEALIKQQQDMKG